MSNADTREALAAALSSVDGVKGHTKQPNAFRPGDGWPLWRGSVREDDNGMFFETWAVMILVPTDEAAASAFCDTHQQGLLDALSEIIFIDEFQPALVPAEGGALNALMITGRCE